MGVDYYNCGICNIIFSDHGDYGLCGNCDKYLCGECNESMKRVYGSFTEEDDNEGQCKMCYECDPKCINDDKFIQWLLYKLNKTKMDAQSECQHALANDEDCFAPISKKRKVEEIDEKE
jgi:hypothetical protein